MAPTTLRPYEEKLREGAETLLAHLHETPERKSVADSDGTAAFVSGLVADPLRIEMTLRGHLYLLLACKTVGSAFNTSDAELGMALDHWTVEMGQLPRTS